MLQKDKLELPSARAPSPSRKDGKSKTLPRASDKLPLLRSGPTAKLISHDMREQSNYIQKAFRLIETSEKSLEADPHAHIQIDSGYGDYAMSIFRKKDRSRRLNQIPNLFTTQFVQSIASCFPGGSPKEETYQVIQSVLEKNRHRSLDTSGMQSEASSARSFGRSLYGNKQKIKDISQGTIGYLNYQFLPSQQKKWVQDCQAVPFIPTLNRSEIQTNLNPIKEVVGRNPKPKRRKAKDYFFKGVSNTKL